jgi:transcriptional regulator with XRE-family HTH domain
MTLAEYRNALGLTQEQCALALGLRNKARVCEIENNKPVSPELALKIEDWTKGAVKAADLNQTVALIEAHMKKRRRRAA